jgi:hypothetical protein
MKGFFKSLGLAFFSLLISLVLCEVVIRMAAPQRLDNNLALYESDDALVFRMQPNFQGVYSSYEFSVPVALNSSGFRDREFGSKREGAIRIVGVGDSFTFGNGVAMEETFLKRLESCLSSNSQPPIEVLNCGVPAYSPQQEFRLVEECRSTLKPDIVILGFFVGNDFVESGDLYDSTGVPTLKVESGALISDKKSDQERGIIRKMSRPFRHFFSTRSHLYVFLRNRSSELLSRFGLHAFNLPPEFCEKRFSTRMEQNWNLTQTIFRNLASSTANNSQRLIVLILPTSYQVYQKTWNQYIAALQLDPSNYDLDKPQRILRDFFDDQDIEYVDALPGLRQNIHAPLFFPIDGHLTPQGHQLVAQQLCDYLATHGTPARAANSPSKLGS